MADSRPALDDEVLDAFKSSVRGGVITPKDPGYDEAHKVYNAMIDKRPALIARCMDAADVISAVNFGRDNGFNIAIRGGSHNGAGLATVDDGLVIDLSPMRGVRVDPEARTAQAGGGALMGDIDHAAHAFGLATPVGIISTTGIGLALGGGIGHTTRKLGLTIDNILSADVVLADGSFVTADAQHNEDLFWAIRGGGGNFGVVTSMTLRLHPVSTVIAGPTLWSLDHATEILEWYRDFLPAQPDELTGFFAFLTVPPGPPFPEHLWMQKMCGVVWSYSGPKDKVEETFAPVRAIPDMALDGVMELPLPMWNAAFDALYPAGYQWYWRADFVKELSDDAIAAHVKHGSDLPTMHSTMHMYPIDGAAGRVGADETPWAYRDAKWAQVIVGVDPDPANADIIRDWTVSYWEATHPYSMGGAYVNFMMEEGQERVKATYGSHYDRLAKIKNRYDPANVFHVNQNIAPAD
jgi:FAD/FMN-containing dehydrogenase